MKPVSKTTHELKSGSHQSLKKAADGADKAHSDAGKSGLSGISNSTDSPVEAFNASREMYAQMFLHMRATSDNPRGAKLIAALQPIALKYLRMPLTLVSQTEAGGRTHLVFKSTDPSIDLTVSCNAIKSGAEWSFTDQDFKGKNSVDIALEPFNAIASVFPQEISSFMLGLTIAGAGLVASFVSAIFLVIAAFRVSVLWGVITFFVPFGNIAFVVCRFREARYPFIAGLISFVITFVGISVSASVLQSLNGIQKMLPDFVPGMSDEQTTQLIRNGLKNSPNLKLQRLN